MVPVDAAPERRTFLSVVGMNGLRLVLFGINSDAGLGSIPRMPLAFFLGGCDVPSDFLLLPVRGMDALASAEEPVEVVV